MCLGASLVEINFEFRRPNCLTNQRLGSNELLGIQRRDDPKSEVIFFATETQSSEGNSLRLGG